MGAPIIFFRKNRADLSFDNVVITASEGQDFVNFLRNRSLRSGWATTGSVDANLTTIIVDLTDPNDVDNIILNGHNFASYKIEKWDPIGAAFVSFAVPIDVTGNTASVTRHVFADGLISKVKLTIRSTQVPDSDKFLTKFMITKSLGQLQQFPTIKEPTNSRARKEQIMLSGKSSIRESIGNFTCKLVLPITSNQNDLSIYETLHDQNEGFHVWLSGGNELQFSSVRQGYRMKDIPLMKCKSEWKPEWYKGIYTTGILLNIELKEVVD